MFSTGPVLRKESLAIGLGLAVAAIATVASAGDLALPLDCRLGETCFVQQLPDMDGGPGVADPFCGIAAYDGHKGTDIRVLSMKDVAAGVAVLAMADGVVLRLRDGVADRLVRTEADRASVGDRECGNGMVIDHGDGLEAQYCHLRRGSIAVRQGQRVSRGEPVGQVGASGMAQFPHVHVTVRRDGKDIDPATGRGLSEGCDTEPEAAASLWADDVTKAIHAAERQVLALGAAGDPIQHASLSLDGPPDPARAASEAIVGWGWVANLRKGDRAAITLTGPDGTTISEQTTEPMDRSKADYSLFAGRRGAPRAGDYTVTLRILEGENVVARRSKVFRIE